MVADAFQPGTLQRQMRLRMAFPQMRRRRPVAAVPLDKPHARRLVLLAHGLRRMPAAGERYAVRMYGEPGVTRTPASASCSFLGGGISDGSYEELIGIVSTGDPIEFTARQIREWPAFPSLLD